MHNRIFFSLLPAVFFCFGIFVHPHPAYAQSSPAQTETVGSGVLNSQNLNLPVDSNDDVPHDSKANSDLTESHACRGALEGATCLVILNEHMRRVRLERDAGTILVGNPTIADVTVLGKDTIFVSARSVGSTNIIALDENDKEIRTYEVVVREPTTKRIISRGTDNDNDNDNCVPDCLRALPER